MEIDEDGAWSNLDEVGVDDILLAYRAAVATARPFKKISQLWKTLRSYVSQRLTRPPLT